jgi:hypothetical protein
MLQIGKSGGDHLVFTGKTPGKGCLVDRYTF